MKLGRAAKFKCDTQQFMGFMFAANIISDEIFLPSAAKPNVVKTKKIAIKETDNILRGLCA